MDNVLESFFLQNPLRIAERTRLTMSLVSACWNLHHNEPIDESAVHLFLCDEQRGDLTREQKSFVRACRAEVDKLYLKQICEQAEHNRKIYRMVLPTGCPCVRPFRQGRVCTPFQIVQRFGGAFGGFRRTKEKAG